MTAPDGRPTTERLTLDCVPASVPAARRFVVSALDGMPPEIEQVAALLVSELATNCVIHAGTGFLVGVAVGDHEIRVEVTDHGPGTPSLATPSPTNPHGRGLRFVDTLASRWGSDIAPAGSKTTWFELAVPDMTSGRSR